MADETTSAIGLSVGATTLAAVTADRAVTRKPVLTLYQSSPAVIGPPVEQSEGDESGLVVEDFVDLVGAAEPVTAADGSTHRGETLLADALRALASVATAGNSMPEAVAVAHPAHWSARAVEALSTALGEVPEFSAQSVSVVSDVAAAVTALQTNPGLPESGIIALCDFGGSGTSFTLVDAARGCRPIGTTLRHPGFSGDGIDRSLLDYVVDDLRENGSFEGELAADTLSRLRGQCNTVKEQLSEQTVTELTVDLPGFRSGIWVTRAELDGVIRQPLDGFLDAASEMLARNEIESTHLAAVAAVGGGANIPAVVDGLAQRFGVGVVSMARPQLAAAIGAALGVAHGPAGAGEEEPPDATADVAAEAPPQGFLDVPAEPADVVAPPEPLAVEVGEDVDVAPVDAGTEPAFAEETEIAAAPAFPEETAPGDTEITPEHAEEVEPEEAPKETAGRASWVRRPLPVILVVALLALLAGAVAVVALRHASNNEPVPPPSPMSTVPTTAQIRTHEWPAPPPSGWTEEPVAPEPPAASVSTVPSSAAVPAAPGPAAPEVSEEPALP